MTEPSEAERGAEWGELTLVALLERARASTGEQCADVALAQLIQRLYPLTERFLARRVRSFRDGAEAAADAAQETMVRVTTALHSCHATTDRELVGWVLVTARRTLVDLYRSPSSGFAMRALTAGLDHEDDLPHVRSGHEQDDGEGAPTARTTLLALAMRAYDALTAETAELLWLRLIGGAEWSEVANEMSTTATAAKRRFQRAQDSLRRAVCLLVSALPEDQRPAVQELVHAYSSKSSPARSPATASTSMEDAA